MGTPLLQQISLRDNGFSQQTNDTLERKNLNSRSELVFLPITSGFLSLLPFDIWILNFDISSSASNLDLLLHINLNLSLPPFPFPIATPHDLSTVRLLEFALRTPLC